MELGISEASGAVVELVDEGFGGKDLLGTTLFDPLKSSIT